MENDKEYLRRAVGLAKESMEKGGFPAGAVIVKDGQIISEAISIGNILHDPTSHAELVSIRKACEVLSSTDLTGATLYESLESCVMCLSAASWAGVSRIVFGCKKTQEMVEKRYYEGITDNNLLNNDNTNKIELIYSNDFEYESLELIATWEKQFEQ